MKKNLNRLNGKEHEVFYEADFLLNEGLSVTDACEQPVVAGGGEGALANVFFGDEEGAAC